MLSRLRWTVNAVHRCHSSRISSDLCGRHFCSVRVENVQHDRVEDQERAADDKFRKALELSCTAQPTSRSEKGNFDVDWLKKEIASTMISVSLTNRCAPSKRRIREENYLAEVTHLLQAIDKTISSCQDRADARSGVCDVLRSNTVHQLVCRLGVLPVTECMDLLPLVLPIVEFSEGKIPFWRMLMHSLAESPKIQTDMKAKHVEPFIKALVSCSSLGNGESNVSLASWALTLSRMDDCMDDLSSDLLVSFGRSLYFQRPPDADQSQRQCQFAEIQRHYEELVLPELCIRALEFTPKEMYHFVKMWSAGGFTSPLPADVVRSQLDFWPTDRPADVASLMLTLVTLAKAGCHGKHGIDIPEVLDCHVDALNSVPVSAASQLKILVPLFPYEAKMRMVNAMLEKNASATTVPDSVELLELLVASGVEDPSCYLSLMSLMRSADDSSSLQHPDHLHTVARILGQRVRQPLPQRELMKNERLFWSFYHHHLLTSTELHLAQALDIFHFLKSPVAAAKLVIVCGRRQAWSADQAVDMRLYEALCSTLLEIYSVYPSHWQGSHAVKMRALFPKTVLKVCADVSSRRLPIPDCCLNLVKAYRDISQQQLPVPAALFDLIPGVVHNLPLQRAVDFLHVAVETLPLDNPKSSRILNALGLRISACLSPTHVSAHHRSSHLDYLYSVAQAAHENEAAVQGVSQVARDVYSRMWPKLDAARNRELRTIEEHAAAVASAWDNAVPAAEREKLLIRMLVHYNHMPAPTSEEQDDLILNALAPYSLVEDASPTLLATDPLLEQARGEVCNAVTSLLSVSEGQENSVRRMKSIAALTVASRKLGVSIPKFDEAMVLETFDAEKEKDLQALAGCRSSLAALAYFSACVSENVQSLSDVAHYGRAASDLFSEGLPYLTRAMRVLVQPLMTFLDGGCLGEMSESSLPPLLEVAMSTDFSHLVPVWKECFSETLEELSILDITVLLRVLRLSDLEWKQRSLYHQVLSAGVCYQHDQLRWLDSSAAHHVVSELCASEVCYPAVVSKVWPKLMQVLFDGGTEFATLPMVYSILSYTKIANIRERPALVQATVCLRNLPQSCNDLLTVTMLSKCCLLLSQHGIAYAPDGRGLRDQHTIAWASMLLCRLLETQDFTEAMYGTAVKALMALETHHHDEVPHFIPWSLCLFVLAFSRTPHPALNLVLNRFAGSHQQKLNTFQIAKWPSSGVVESLSTAVTDAIGRHLFSHVLSAGIARVPLAAAFDGDGHMLPLNLCSNGCIAWPEATAHRVAWLVAPEACGAHMPLAAQTVLSFEAILLKQSGWTVLTVEASDIVNDRITSAGLAKQLSAALQSDDEAA